MSHLLSLPSTREEAWRWSNLSALPGLAAAERNASLAELRDLPWIESPRLSGQNFAITR